MTQITELRIGNLLYNSDKKIISLSSIESQNPKYKKFITSRLEYFDYNDKSELSKITGVVSSLVTDFEPIPLTEEWLLKMGFDKDISNDDEKRDTYSIQVSNCTSLYFDCHKDWMRDNMDVEWYLSYEWNNNHFKNEFWNKPKSVHEVQNLYFCLTGQELTINQ